MTATKALRKIAFYFAVFLVILLVGFPIYSIMLNSVQYDVDIRDMNRSFIPTYITLSQFREVLSEGHIVPIREATWTSFYISVLAAMVSVLIASLAAYGFSRNKLKWGRYVLLALSANYVLPAMLFLLPIFVIFANWGIADTPFTIVLLYTAFLTPLLIWVIKAFVEAVPEEVEQAARVDGCSYLRLFVKLYLPIMRPGIAAAFLYSFVLSWVEFLTPLMFTSRTRMLTTSLGLYSGTHTIELGQLNAAAVFAMLPVIILTAVFAGMITQVMTGAEKK